MRITLNLEDDVLQEVKRYAESRSLAVGKIVSQLGRRGLAAQTATRTVNGLRVFDLPAGSPQVTKDRVARL